MNDIEHVEKVLGAGLSRAVVKTNPKGMSYVDGYYVDSKLNEAFGPLGWHLRVDRLECTTDGFYDDPQVVAARARLASRPEDKRAADTLSKKEGQIRIGYMAVVTLTCNFRRKAGEGDLYDDPFSVSKTDVGHGSGIGKDRAECVESAVKEAVTDAMKRAAKHLGPAMGLALYDKDQRQVREATPEEILALVEGGLLEDAKEAIQALGKNHADRQRLIDAYKAARDGAGR